MRRGDLATALRLFPYRIGPWLRFELNRGRYRLLDEAEVRLSRRSDTVFIFGSGWSLTELGTQDWKAIAEHDTLGFNWFVNQRFVRCDFHLIRGIPDSDLTRSVWRRQLAQYFTAIGSNPHFSDTVFLVQTGFRALNGNRAIGLRLLPERNPVFLWRTNMRDELPSRTFADGLVHGHSTLNECINFAFLAGWKRVVLAGVDLYDRRYFWLDPEETRSVDLGRGANAEDPHDRAGAGIVEALGIWARWLAGEGVELSVLNPRSLLAAELPVYALA
jgi:hypothetical protein